MVKKMTDNEIVKALNTALGMEHISIYCANIKKEVQKIRVLDIIDLINRLQAENKRLNGLFPKGYGFIVKRGRLLVYAPFESDIYEAEQNLKAEAYKEFAERLKEKAKKTEIVCSGALITTNYSISDKNFNNLLKEMTGE